MSEPIKPATDEEISLMWPIYQHDTAADGMVRMLFKRIESDAAKLKERDEQIARYETLIIRFARSLMPDAHEWPDDLRREIENEGRDLIRRNEACRG